MPTIQYDIDLTGENPDNLISNEHQVLTEQNNPTYNLLIPTFSPFYTNNFSLKHVEGNNETILVEGVDYIFSLIFLGASASMRNTLYGGISVTSVHSSGNLFMTYQTLGGKWLADRNLVLNKLVERNYNPRITSWDVLTNVQEVFPPTNHPANTAEVIDYPELVATLNKMSDVIRKTSEQKYLSVAEMFFYSKNNK